VPPGLPEGHPGSGVVVGEPAALPRSPVARWRALWGNGFVLPLLPALYALALVVFHGELRSEHVGFALVALALGLLGRATANIYRALLPFVATSFGYDLVRYARALWVRPERVLGCELRRADLGLVSLGGTSVPEWLGAHHVPIADLAAAVPYAAFIYVALGYAVYLWFRDRPRMRVFLWAFAIANGISFTTWILLPAAPPWYVHAHGCTIDLAAAPSPAGLARVDELLGIHYFSGFYSRAASVFGALPSMHCAYPVLGLLTGWRGARPRTKVAHVVYALWMASAAMYLQHHWAIDVLAGWATAAVGVAAARWLVLRPREEPAPLTLPEAAE
jgi:hypothetical protein